MTPPRSARAASSTRHRAGDAQLVGAVRAALHALIGQTDPDQHRAVDPVAPARVAQYLRAVLTLVPTGSGPHAEAVEAVTAACADLDDHDVAGAYLALHAAHSALREAATATWPLPSTTRHDTVTDPGRRDRPDRMETPR